MPRISISGAPDITFRAPRRGTRCAPAETRSPRGALERSDLALVGRAGQALDVGDQRVAGLEVAVDQLRGRAVGEARLDQHHLRPAVDQLPDRLLVAEVGLAVGANLHHPA